MASMIKENIRRVLRVYAAQSDVRSIEFHVALGMYARHIS